MINIQFKKGVLELGVLALLIKRDYYGYEIIEEISKKIEISAGTIYPLLSRLKNDKLVTTYLKESNEGAPRKYYKLTESGKNKYKRLSEEWASFSKIIDSLLLENK